MTDRDPVQRQAEIEPRTITGDYGTFILAADEAAAQAHAKAEGWRIVGYAGWMHRTWDYDNYETEAEFLAESGYESWWMGCTVAEGTEARDGLLESWEATSDG